MADDQTTNPQDQQVQQPDANQQPDPAQQPDAPAAEEAKPRKTGRRGGSLEEELEELEQRRAVLKRTKPEDLKGDEFAEVKTRIAEIKAELGIQ